MGFHMGFGLNISSLRQVTGINIFINHVCAHNDAENRLQEPRLRTHLPVSAQRSPKSPAFRLPSAGTFFPQAICQDFTGYIWKTAAEKLLDKAEGTGDVPLRSPTAGASRAPCSAVPMCLHRAETEWGPALGLHCSYSPVTFFTVKILS